MAGYIVPAGGEVDGKAGRMLAARGESAQSE